jgi:hypothetical protein
MVEMQKETPNEGHWPMTAGQQPGRRGRAGSGRARLSLRCGWCLLVFAALGCLVQRVEAARGRPYLNAARTTFVTDTGSLMRGCIVGSGPTVAQLVAITNYGCNAVHMYAEAPSGYAAGYNSNTVDKIVQMTRTNGLYLIMTIGSGGVASNAFITDFWNFYAGRYANETHVLYEIQNESTSGAGSSDAVLAVQTNMYKLIRSKAPNTPILLFSYMAYQDGGKAIKDINALGNVVNWTNAAIAFHGYGRGVRLLTRACLDYVLARGYACFQTEFYDWPYGMGHFNLGDSASMYANISQTGDMERLGISWLAFMQMSHVTDDTRFKNRMKSGGILWTPEYGSWPSGSRGTYGTNGEPWSLTNLSSTLHIEAENFDTGGQGIAYSDTTATNQGGLYRPGEGVDIQTCTDAGGGYNVGWIEPGDWLEYTAYFEYAGLYDLKLRVASTQATCACRVLLGGASATGLWTFPGTGGYQVWQTVTNRISLTPGQQVLRVEITNGFNLNWIEVTPAATGLVSNGAYRLLARHSGKALQVEGSATANGAGFEQSTYVGASNQIWVLTHRGANQYTVTDLNSGKAIDEDSWTRLTGDNLHTYTSANSVNQRWMPTPTNSGYYAMVNANSGLVMDVGGAGTTNGAPIYQWTWSGGNNQQWVLQASQFYSPMLVASGGGVRHEFDDLLANFKYVHITNGNPGVSFVDVFVNGIKFTTGFLTNGQTKDLNVGGAMLAGSTTNVIVFEAYGAVGAGLFATIGYKSGDAVAGAIEAGTGDQVIYLPTISITNQGANVVVSYPTSELGTDYSGYTLQQRDRLNSNNWQNAAVPQVVGGRFTISLTATNAARFFRLVK